MKHLNSVFFLALLISLFTVVACDDKKEDLLPPEEEIENPEEIEDPGEEIEEPGGENEQNEIKLEDVIGTYKVQAYAVLSNNGVPVVDESETGNIWEIAQDGIRIACAPKVGYTYDNNIFKVGEIDYRISIIGNNYSFTFTVDNKNIIVLLTTTTDVCQASEPGPDPYIPPTVGTVELDKLYGYATEATGTTGGQGATAQNTHHFDNGKAFQQWLNSREKNKSKEPAIVWLSGTFNKDDGRGVGSPWFDVKRTSNITITGINDFKMKNIGFFLVEAENIIIRNVYIEMPKADNGADGVSLQESNNVWVDHCTFESVNQTYDYEDGSCDITHGSYNVTVSWNHFIKTQKTSLVGHSNNNESEDVKITATFHHNFFDESNSRHPRIRFGKVHVYNNYFNKVSTYGVGSAYGAMVLVENNYFEGVHLPTDICTYPAKQSGSNYVSNLEGTVAGYLYEAGNVYVNKPSNASDPYPFTNVEYKAYNGEKLATPLTYNDFKPAYSYIVDASETIKDVVPAGAGVGKLGYVAAPIPVDNAGITIPEQPENPPVVDPENPGGGEETGDWVKADIGPNSGGSYTPNGSEITVTGKGKFESSDQSFSFVYQEITGDFVMTAKVNGYNDGKGDNSSQAGLMLTPNITATGNDFLHALSGMRDDKITFSYSQRVTAEVAAGRGTLSGATGSGDAYLKLERVGSTYKASYSLDGGNNYGNVRTVAFTATLPDKLYVGLAVSSGDNSKLATAIFSNVKINGELQSFEKP
ncbi:Pectate lyase [termite gut metagenome]|uniref:Pectate lyase n=1 Tax=termite gut metagenome TaxID=433724 RepID=A0A5J4T204_9ZZZZ